MNCFPRSRIRPGLEIGCVTETPGRSRAPVGAREYSPRREPWENDAGSREPQRGDRNAGVGVKRRLVSPHPALCRSRSPVVPRLAPWAVFWRPSRAQEHRRKCHGPLGILLTCVGLTLSGCAAHPKGVCGGACPTIESATHIIEFPSQRLTILKRVAARPDLTPHEQVYLVNAVFMGGYSDDMADALVALIGSPGCTDEACDAIRRRMKFTRMLGRAERRVVEALTRRNETHAAVGRGTDPE